MPCFGAYMQISEFNSYCSEAYLKTAALVKQTIAAAALGYRDEYNTTGLGYATGHDIENFLLGGLYWMLTASNVASRSIHQKLTLFNRNTALCIHRGSLRMHTAHTLLLYSRKQSRFFFIFISFLS